MTLRRQQHLIRIRRNIAWFLLCLFALGLGSITAWTLHHTMRLIQDGEQGAMLAAVQPSGTNPDLDATPMRQVRIFHESELDPVRPRLEADWLDDPSIPVAVVAPHHADREQAIVRNPEPAMDAQVATVSVPAGPTFNGRPIRVARTIRMHVTAYSPDERSCGKWADGITASGASVWTNGMKLVAADTRLLPFGSIVSVPGYHGGKPVPVLDRGGAIKGHRLDVLYPTHEIARRWGNQWLQVTVWEYAD